MSEEIYINTGTTIQQPYQGQSVRNAQNAETRQTTAQTPANAQTPFTYQNRQPTTYRNPVNSQEPNIRNAQTPFTYQRTGRVPFIYTHRSPFTYQRTGQTPFTYQHQTQQPYIANSQQPNIRNAQSPYIANKQSPYIANSQYTNTVNQQSPYIANAQQPYPYIANKQSPFTYNHRSPFTYQRTGQNPFTYQNQQPYPFITTVPYTYNSTGTATVYPLEQTWYPTGFTLRASGNLNQASSGTAYVRCEIRAAVDTANDRIIIEGKTAKHYQTTATLTDYVDYVSPVADSSSFYIKYFYEPVPQPGGGTTTGTIIQSSPCNSSTQSPADDGYNNNTYYTIPASTGTPSGISLIWRASANVPNNGSNNCILTTTGSSVTVTLKALPTGGGVNSYITTASFGQVELTSYAGAVATK